MKTICADWSPIGAGDAFRAMLSLRETVVLASVTESAVRKDIEDKVLWPIRLLEDNKPRFRWVDVFLVAAVYRNHLLNRRMRKIALDKLEFCVAPSFRKPNCHSTINWDTALWEKPSNLVAACSAMELDDYVYLDFGKVRDELTPRVDLYARGLTKIDERPDVFNGEAVFKNTRLPVRQIGQMVLKGEPIASILEDYPYLNEEDVLFATIYSEAHPNLGRPSSRKGSIGGKVSAG